MWFQRQWIKGLTVPDSSKLKQAHAIVPSQKKLEQFVLQSKNTFREAQYDELQQCKSHWESVYVHSMDEIAKHPFMTLLAKSKVKQHWVWGKMDQTWTLHFLMEEQESKEFPSYEEWMSFLRYHQFDEVLLVSSFGGKWASFGDQHIQSHWEIQKMMIVFQTPMVDHWVLGSDGLYVSERKNNYLLQDLGA